MNFQGLSSNRIYFAVEASLQTIPTPDHQALKSSAQIAASMNDLLLWSQHPPSSIFRQVDLGYHLVNRNTWKITRHILTSGSALFTFWTPTGWHDLTYYHIVDLPSKSEIYTRQQCPVDDLLLHVLRRSLGPYLLQFVSFPSENSCCLTLFLLIFYRDF